MQQTADELRARILTLLPGFTPDQSTTALGDGGQGASPPRPEGPHPQDISGPIMGAVVEEIVLGGPAPVPATFVRPEGRGPFPAVLYCHAHGGDYRLGRRELLDGSRFLQEPGYAVALAAMGFASLCIDMPGFGDRQSEGSENALSKALAWKGESLFGRMLDDLSRALGYLGSRVDVDAGRLYTLGLSMGAAHAYWLAALDTRVAGCAHLCMLADTAPMIETGAHDSHGHYLTVPGLLAVAETGDIAGLIAPRPQLICHGANDHLTPAVARDAALGRVSAAYSEVPQNLTTMIDPDTGHKESAPMRVATLDFLARISAPNRHNFEG